VVDALAFLRQYNLRGSVPVGKESSSWAAATRPLTPREPQYGSARKSDGDLPPDARRNAAYAEEIEEAKAEGVKLRLLTALLKL